MKYLNQTKPKQMVFPFYITTNNNNDSHSVNKERIESNFVVLNDINKGRFLNEQR